jgi:hypothetical protein
MRLEKRRQAERGYFMGALGNEPFTHCKRPRLVITRQRFEISRHSCVPIVPKDNNSSITVENCLGGRSAAGRAVQDANSFGKGNEFNQRSHLHFLHYLVAMGLDRAFGRA